MKALTLLALILAVLFVAACVKAPAGPAMAEKPSAAAGTSLGQDIGTLESSDTDSSVNDLDQLDKDIDSVPI